MKNSPLLLLLLFCAGCAGFRNPAPAGLTGSFEWTAEPSAMAAPALPFGERPTFDDYLNYAFTNNAALKAARQEWIAAKERVRQARTLPNPELSAEYLIEQHDTRYQAGLKQSFPVPGTLSLRGKKAEAEAEAARHRYETERFMIYDRMAGAVFNYHYLGRTIAVYEEQLELIQNQEAVARQSYSAGKTPFTFLLRLQMESEKLDSDLAGRRDERAARSSAISTLLNILDHPELPWPHVTPSEPGLLDYNTFEPMLSDLNPELKEAEAELNAALYQKRLAKKAFWPSFSLGAGVMVMSGMAGKEDPVDIGISAGISLPLWQRSYRATARAADAEALAAAERKNNLKNELRNELRVAIYKAQDAWRRMALYKNELIPKAEQTINVMNQSLAAGRADLIELIDAQQLLLEFKLQYERALADHQIAQAEIGCCIGQFANVTVEIPHEEN